MHRITLTLLTILAAVPAFGNARLPVVNVTAGGVSARAAFGEEIKRPAPVVAETPVQKKRVVARTKKQTATAQNVIPARAADIGAPIAAVSSSSADVLVPRRPSSDLWAKNSDAPLRMPRVDEFKVVRSDAALPEENLDAPKIAATPVAPVVAPASPTPKVAPRVESNVGADIDAQIARLNELQRRADVSVRSATTVATVSPEKKEVAPIAPAPVKITRMVVPMDDDVVVRSAKRTESPKIAAVRNDMASLSPSELRAAFRKTFLSENKHLSTFQIDDAFDVASDVTTSTGEFVSRRDLSESGGIRPLEIKIKFRDYDSALSRDNYNLLTEYAGIVLSNPTRAVQISIPQNVINNTDKRKLAARRLAIIEQALRDAGVSEHRILPVLATRDDAGFLLRMISVDQYETLTQQKNNIFGDTVNTKTYKSMSW